MLSVRRSIADSHLKGDMSDQEPARAQDAAGDKEHNEQRPKQGKAPIVDDDDGPEIDWVNMKQRNSASDAWRPLFPAHDLLQEMKR